MQTDFGWLLIHATWQTGVVALALRLLLVRLSTAQARYRACWGAIVLCVLLAAFTWQQDLFRDVVVLDARAPQPVRAWSVQDGVALLFWVWLAVVIPGLMRLAAAGVNRRLRYGAPATTWQALSNHTAAQMGVRDVPVVMHASLDDPVTFGVLRPVVCIPASMEMTDSEKRFVLAHELAHVRRYDTISLVLQRFVEIAFSLQPAVRWITRQMHTEREYCCDDLAVEYCGDALGYARALTVVERLRGRQVSFSTALGAGGGRLHERISRIAERTTPPVRFGLRMSVVAGSLLLCAGMLAQMQPDRYVDGLQTPDVVIDPAPAPPPQIRARATVRHRPVPREYVPPVGWMSQRIADWADEADALPEADVLAQVTPPPTPPIPPVESAPPPPTAPVPTAEPVVNPPIILSRSVLRGLDPVRVGRAFRLFRFPQRMRIRNEIRDSVLRSLPALCANLRSTSCESIPNIF